MNVKKQLQEAILNRMSEMFGEFLNKKYSNIESVKERQAFIGLIENDSQTMKILADEFNATLPKNTMQKIADEELKKMLVTF